MSTASAEGKGKADKTPLKDVFEIKSGKINMGDLFSILLLPKSFGHLYTWTTGTDTMTRGSRYPSKGHQTLV